MQVGPNRCTYARGVYRIAAGPHVGHVGEVLNIEGAGVGNARDKRSTFLVDAEERGDSGTRCTAKLARAGDEVERLGRLDNVLLEVHEAANRNLLQGALGLAACDGGFGYAGELLGRNEEELGHLLLERHGGEQALDRALGLRRRCVLRLLDGLVCRVARSSGIADRRCVARRLVLVGGVLAACQAERAKAKRGADASSRDVPHKAPYRDAGAQA